MASETELLRLALRAYEAAAEPDSWTDFLEQYAKVVAADFTVLQIHDLEQPKSVVLHGFGLSSPLRRSYNDYYSKLNLWREHGRTLLTPGRVNLTEEQCPREVLEKSEFYNDYIRHIGAYGVGMVISAEETGVVSVSAQRKKREYGEDEREIARFLLPYLTRAWTVYRRLGLLAGGTSVLEGLPYGVAFLAPGRGVVYANHAAQEIFCAKDGLEIRRGALCAADPSTDTRLGKAVDRAICPDSRPVGRAAVKIARPSLRAPYQVVAAPLLARFRWFVGMPPPAAVVFITDPERRPSASVDLLIQFYGLTRKEAALAAKLSEGKSVAQAAQELTIRYETARTHLRRIFSKTGVSRQAELLVLMARLPGSN
ncbi:MAG TPA: helix-turn-helix transcriptional regulator [Bryobacteraceae bacterium]|nr:helix-turn-helix transcriptional regulator [Bryobacteraceae bacterium]